MATHSVSAHSRIVKERGNIVGKKSGSLTVLGPSFAIRRIGRDGAKRIYLCVCECDCGNVVVRQPYLVRGKCRCGPQCPKKPSLKIAGLPKWGPLYHVWSNMKRRCTEPANPAFKDYGGRGIEVCREWSDSYFAFESWAMANGWKKGLEIDRIDNDQGYAPWNCRFVTTVINARNRRSNRLLTAFGETKCIADWADDERIPVTNLIISDRLHSGWDVMRALTTPKGGFR